MNFTYKIYPQTGKLFWRLSTGLIFLFLLLLQNAIAQEMPAEPPEISGGAQAYFEMQEFLKKNPNWTFPKVEPPLPAEEKVLSNLIRHWDAINIDAAIGRPPDPIGAVGPNHVVNVVNYQIEGYTKEGVLQHRESLQNFFGSATITFDPKVIYDQYENRFLVVTLENDGKGDADPANDVSVIYLAVSAGANPNMAWNKKQIPAKILQGGQNHWVDYPGFAVDEEAVYITNNLYRHSNNAFGGVRLWIVNKGTLGGFYAGGGIASTIHNPYATIATSSTSQPAHTFGDRPENQGTYLLSYAGANAAGNERIRWVRIEEPLGAVNITRGIVDIGNITPGGALANAPQKGSISEIETNDTRVLNAVWRDSTLATCFTIVGTGANAGQATAHWLLLNVNEGEDPNLQDQGNVGGEEIAAGTYTFFPSVALNKNLDLAIGFSASGPNIFPGAYFTVREAYDPPGTTQVPKTLRAGMDFYINGSNRWGDYTGTVVDPTEDLCFWVYNEYAIARGPTGLGRYGTAWGTFCAQTFPVPTITCPANPQPIEWPAGFNILPVPANTPQDPSIDPLNYGYPTTTASCGTATVTYQDELIGPTPANCPNLWIVKRTWTVTDGCYQTATCVQTFTFKDTTEPDLFCPADPQPIEWTANFNTNPVPVNTPQDPSIDPATYGTPMVIENSGIITITYQDVLAGPSPLNCPNIWLVQRIWTATDACNQSSKCIQNFIFKDTTKPLITCPSDPASIEWPMGFNTNAVPVNTPQDPIIDPAGYGMPTVSDNCGTPTVTYQDVLIGPIQGNGPIIYKVERHWTATDICNQTADCIQTFTFTDTTPPGITTCPPMRIVEGCTTADIKNGNLTALAFSTVSLAISAADFANEGGVAADNCEIQSYSYIDVATGNTPIVVTRIFTLVDICNNIETCTQTITIKDTTKPIVGCQNIGVSLTSNGNLTITPNQVFDANISSDNCNGAVTPVSVIPNTFTCQNTGANNVTLTAEDPSGNKGTCNAIVTIYAYITNINLTVINETCLGDFDGQIIVSATSPSGQVRYSIDGGLSYQVVGKFTNLPPLNYPILIKVFGIPESCDTTVFATVNNGLPLSLWYKDLDNDGHSDGVTQLTCLQPTGYKPANLLFSLTGDCNDYNASTHVGALEVCDGHDNDCDGVIPNNEVDTDSDGYRLCQNDCNDNNPDINPGASEICNGVDDNCDGQVDEELADETFIGNINFSTQQQIDAWPSCFTIIQGHVNIVGVGITNLEPLMNIEEITGNLTIQNTGLTDMDGLDELDKVGGTLTIIFNSLLTTLDGLDYDFSTIGGSLYIYYNFQLSNCCSIYNVINGGVAGYTVIFFNKVGCNSVAEINGNCAPTPLVGNQQDSFKTTGSELLAAVRLSLIPNPAGNKVNVIFKRTSPTATLKIIDMLGRVVFENELEEGTDRLTIDLNNAPFENGLYLVSLYENGEMTTKQLVVQQ